MSSRMHNTRTGISDMVRTAQEGEIKRAATLKMSAEARLLRHQELERIRKQEEEEYTDDSNHARTSSSRYSSRHSSIEPTYTSGTYGNDPRELKRLLLQLDEKYKDVLVINAQLDCEKQFLTYSVDLLKDKLEDATESNQYNQKCAADRKKELAYQRMQLAELNHQLEIARQQIAIRDELITERGLVLVNVDGSESSAGIANGDTGQSLLNGATGCESSHSSATLQPSSHALPSSNAAPLAASSSSSSSSSYTILSKSNAEALKSICGSDIDSKIATLLEERAKDKERIETLKLHLAEERERIELVQKLDTRAKGGDPENLRQAVQAARSQAQEYKFRLEQANQKITGLEGDIIRLEGQVKRFKTIAENAEMQEDQLKQERRKIHRELREALSTIDDLKSENSTLQRKIDKLSRGPPGVPSGSSLRYYRGSSQAR
ncbi:unnamed protein product [Hydatigera taeniaeformis]|uniref:Leucine-rich repeat flightless-interacting protein 2 n=1 Tax=Hydatigena taeniaeformis TaxID=6205 RepID=A0A158RE13_HYDTA|nr:unnamed protein product [Hydatigera taeniaeformis]